MCWRRDNLTEAQRADPRNMITETMPLCDEHQAFLEGVCDWVKAFNKAYALPALAEWQRRYLKASFRNINESQ
jgi:hypothetical protein